MGIYSSRTYHKRTMELQEYLQWQVYVLVAVLGGVCLVLTLAVIGLAVDIQRTKAKAYKKMLVKRTNSWDQYFVQEAGPSVNQESTSSNMKVPSRYGDVIEQQSAEYTVPVD